MINGNRVKQARELERLTQAGLAEGVGVSQSTIAYVENGRLTPSDELLDAIAQETGFPSTFFEQEVVGDFPLGSLLLFRAKASVTAADQGFAHRYAQTIYECAMNLAARVTTIPLRLPQLDDDVPEGSAALTRAALGMSPDTPITNLIHAIERAGVLVLALPVALENIDAFSLWAGSQTERPVIIVLSGAPGDRLRFSVAHEIAHLVMHRSMKGDVQGIEREADQFAGALLLPGVAMEQEIIPPVTLTNLAALKRRWRVSMQTLIMRAFELRIISERQKRYLFQQLSSRGWRIREPPALDVQAERPRALRQMAELLYTVPIDYQRLAADTCLPEQLLQDTIEAHEGKDVEYSNVVPFPDSGRKMA